MIGIWIGRLGDWGLSWILGRLSDWVGDWTIGRLKLGSNGSIGQLQTGLGMCLPWRLILEDI